MAASRRSQLSMTLTGSTSDASSDGVTSYSMAINQTYDKTYSEGTSTDQADRIYDTNGTLAASGTLDIDLSGSLADRIGNTVVFAKIKRIMVLNKTSTTGINLQVGAGSNPFITIWIATGDGIKVGPSGVFVWDSPVDGFAVTAGTGDILRLTNLSGAVSCDYRIIIVGTSV